jgi:uncharacterized protein YfiM (DUF2279 family)
MDGVLHVAVVLVSLGGAVSVQSPRDAAPQTVSVRDPLPRGLAAAGVNRTADPPAPRDAALRSQQPADRWLSEDKFRHAGASWAAMVFTYAGARAIHDDGRSAIAIALPVTAALGLAKEAVDHRRGGPFSARDLAADALGAGAAWLVLRAVR